ncbi:MAG: Stk1 family PASTA domain-containing Ser/Thr kinase [Firmicutes bacterium]|nr:Stk1 family PASTA domain-containing Ser/Thr kinase [Bacillota bacterium]
MSSRILAGRYELLEKIGDGGMAVVYKARCKFLNRNVAVKILKPEFMRDAKFIESFRRESQAAASLSHPNIVNVYDVGRDGNIHYIVMELIDGAPLSEIIREQGHLKPRDAVNIAKQIASALSCAHKNQLIHRDVKPHNVLITKDGTAKITDFGIAKAVNAATVVGQTGTVMGSVHYLSPEQARGDYVDEKTDIYSLGILLFEMLTGKVPFDAENPVTVALMHMNDEVPRLSQLLPGIAPDLEAIVAKATNKVQINRFLTADEMYDALDHASLSAIGTFNKYQRMVEQERKNEYDATKVMSVVNRPEPKKPLPEDPFLDQLDENKRESSRKHSSAKNSKNSKPEQNKATNKKFKVDKIKLSAIIVALIAAILVVALVIVPILGNHSGKPEQLEAPPLTGMTVEEATAELEKLGLKLKVASYVVSDKYEEGEIVSQDPKEGIEVKEGFSISVNVSKGSGDRPQTMPELTGKTVDSALYMLAEYGYTKGEITEEFSDLPIGIVIDQSIAAGEEAAAGTVVNLVVSKGKESVELKMPDLVGKSLSEATSALSEAGLALGDTAYEPHETYPKDRVTWQSIEPGATVQEGTAIDLMLSEGTSEGAGGPNLSSFSLYVPFGMATNDVFYMSVVVSDENGVTTLLNNEQKQKSNGGETIVVTGTGQGTIRIYFDEAEVLTYNADFSAGVLL